MKKSTKIVLAISAAMIVFGSGLFVTAWAVSGGNIGVMWNPQDGISRSSFSAPRAGGRFTSGTSAPEAFQSIELDTDYGDVKLIPSDRYYVEYSMLSNYPDPEIFVQNNVLVVRNEPQSIMTFNWNLLNNIGDKAYIRVYYPKDITLHAVSLESGLGEIDLKDVTANQVEIDAAMGDIVMDNVNAKKLEIDADMGAVELKNCTSSDFSASLAMGDLEAQNCTLSNVEVENDMGTVSLDGDIGGIIDISCSMGAIELRTSRQLADFFLDISTDMGDAEVNGEHFRSGTRGSASAPNQIKISCSMGAVELHFAA